MIKMEKEILEILEFEDKKTQAGKDYVRFKTSQGWISCFDKTSCEELKKLCPGFADVELKQVGNFKNIVKFCGKGEGGDVVVEKVGKVAQITSNQGFPASMKVAYAKDVFCAVCTRISQAEFDAMDEKTRLALMDLSIKVVEKAIKAFE